MNDSIPSIRAAGAQIDDNGIRVVMFEAAPGRSLPVPAFDRVITLEAATQLRDAIDDALRRIEPNTIRH